MVEVSASNNQTLPGSSGNKFISLLGGGLSLAVVNRVLLILAAVSCAYFILSILLGAAKIAGAGQHIRNLESKNVNASAADIVKAAAARSSAVDPALSNRNIFQPAGAVAVSGEAGPSSTASAYRIAGISESKIASETTVMVENTKTKLTYFLQYGQPIEGLELERILEDKVIVKIGGKSVELE